jgi:hypothetical protein
MPREKDIRALIWDIVDENIWRVATVRIPELIAALEPLLPEAPPPAGD